jgi:uncharacterized protein YndB with AHSA1/START domain
MCNRWLHIEQEVATMEAIRHRVGIYAPIEDVYDAFATPEGVKQWWTTDVRGESRLGGELAFRFGRPEPAAVVELAELTPPSRVVWRCVEGPPEWVGARITFDLRAHDDETVVVFTHDNWREPVEFMHHCTTAWAYYLLSAKRGLEDGTATPWPHNHKVSSWGS